MARPRTKFKVRRNQTRAPRDKELILTAYSLGLPATIGEMLPENAEFTVELTKEGILYRVVRKQGEELPPWIKK